jgi:hypothetical protein
MPSICSIPYGSADTRVNMRLLCVQEHDRGMIAGYRSMYATHKPSLLVVRCGSRGFRTASRWIPQVLLLEA